MNTLASAICLHSEGFCLLPLLPGGKRPARRWKRLQTERPTADELVEWFARNDYEIGIVTGAISGITVIDCDSLDAAQACRLAGIDSPLTQRTRRGIHLVYRHAGERNTVRVGGVPGVDRRGEGGYVRAYPDAATWTRAAVDAAPLVPEAARDGGRQPERRGKGKSESSGECYIWDDAREAWRYDFDGHSLWFARETMELVGSE